MSPYIAISPYFGNTLSLAECFCTCQLRVEETRQRKLIIRLSKQADYQVFWVNMFMYFNNFRRSDELSWGEILAKLLKARQNIKSRRGHHQLQISSVA